ncbi:MAG: hypothetical protein PQJ46_11510 [Spirochaetales bacterium]|nr:hypothetical protein [Spirochaetales bacterium]
MSTMCYDLMTKNDREVITKRERGIMTKKDWAIISSRVKAVFNMGVEKAKWLDNCEVGRFIAAIPFLAGCDKPFQTAFSHLCIYVMSIDESTKEVYFHSREDDADLYLRLAPISDFIGGNQKVISCCMDLLALNMVSNYKNDQAADKSIGKYNPLNDGDWNYDELAEKLKASINKNITPEVRAVYDIEDSVRGLWM